MVARLLCKHSRSQRRRPNVAEGSMQPTNCHQCNAALTGNNWRLLPTAGDDALVDAYFCEACWPTALATVRHALVTADASEFEDLMQAAFIRAYLQARDIKLASPNDLPHPGGLAADALRWLDQIKARGGFWWRQVMCSGCYQTSRELNITTIPWWNSDAGAYLSTYQCPTCLPTGIADTRARLARNANNDVVLICALLERYAVFVHEYRRGDAADTLIPIVDAVLTKLAEGSLVLPIGAVA